MTQDAGKDFFISYTGADRGWAEWIGWHLEKEGYSTVVQAWDFRPGSNFVLEMQKAASEATRTIAVFSPKYLDALYTKPEWAAAFKQDPTGEHGKLLPIRVLECKPTGLLAALVYVDLVGLDEAVAHSTLLAGIKNTRVKPTAAPVYPGGSSSVGARLIAPTAPPSFPGSWPSVWNVPYERNPFFTGREQLLLLLHEKLTSTKAAALTQAQAIRGLGGIGKTQTAIEYAYRYQKEYRYVLWVGAATREILLSDVLTLAALLGIAGQDAQDPQRTVAAFRGWLAQERDWLLILDNADDVRMVRDVLSGGGSMLGHLLLTTRAQAMGTLAQGMDVEKMDEVEGTLLLLRRANVLEPDAPLERASTEDRAHAEGIVAALDGLPLALDQAGAYIEEMGCALSEYLSLYQQRRTELLGRRSELSPKYPSTVASTWSLSFQRVEQESAAAADLLRVCAFLAPDAIPIELFTEGAPELGKVLLPVAADGFRLNEALEVLRRYSLVRRNAGTKTLSLHRLVQAVLTDGIDAETQRLWAERAVRAVSRVFPEVDYGTWTQCERYLSQAQGCAELIDHYGLMFLEAADLLYRTGIYLRQRARYKEVEPLLQCALDIYEQVRGPEHPETANVLDSVARLYQEQGKYEQAEPLYLRALAIHEQVSGPVHPNTAITLHALATLYQAQSKYEQAEPLYLRSLRISEKVEGPEHPNTAATLHALATLYQAQGKYEQAEPLYQRSLRISEQVEGLEHPDTAATLHELARLYRAQGKYEQAEPLYQRSLRISEQVLGPEHPYTAIALRSYASLLRAMKRGAEAARLEDRAKGD